MIRGLIIKMVISVPLILKMARYLTKYTLLHEQKWHKRCYNCLDCTRPLDAMVFCDGPDGEIYCKLCYAKRFGPKGYGFAAGAGGVLVPENIA